MTEPNGAISKELMERILAEMAQVDGGNQTVCNEIYSRFNKLFPEHSQSISKLFPQFNAGMPFRPSRTI